MITIRGINGDILTHFDNDVPDGNPYFEPVLTDDMESLVSSFSFSVPLELADTEHLVGLNQVLVKDRQGDLRLFVITDVHEVWTTVGGTLQVNCEDISINEMNNIIVSPFESLNFQDTLTKTFKDSGWTLKYGANWKDVDNTTFKVENYDNMRSVIASIVDTYGCQFKFMAQENQFGEITRVAEVYKSRGNDTGKYFYYDRDLLGIERDINHADIKTAIHPYYTGYDGKTYSLKGFAPANPDPDFKKDKASPLIINREASKLFDDGNSYRIMPYKTEVEGNPELVYREAIKELKKYAEPIYTYSVNVLLLQNMIGWEGEGIDLGDTVWMKERVGNRELGLEARVTAYEYHEDDPSKDVVTFSNFKEIDTTDVPELAERIFIAYANSEDGIIDFSITDSVGKAYMGVYTAAVSTQSTDPSTYSWTRIKGEDGVSAPTLNLTSSQQVMKFNSNGTPDGDQTIIFTALKQNSTETVTWEAIPYKGDIAQPTITLGGTGDVRSLSSADWNNEWTRVKVTVSMGSLKDIQTVVMVSDGATGASGKAIVGYVTNESTTFAASSDGTVTDYGNGGGKFVLYEGTNKVTSGVTFARVSQVGINLLINDTTGEYKVSNMTTDMAQASVSATYKGITITKFLSFSKSKQGVKGDKGDTGNDGIAGKDGIGLKSTTVTYAASASGTTAPSTGWQEQVPTVAPNNFLWTRTVWTYTDDTSETGYSVAKMGRDGAKGNDGIAGKDGVGIAKTLIEYAVSASGTTKPTSGWSTSIPTTPQGQYLWTRTTWTYTDATTEQGFTVARMGQDGARGNDGIAGKDGVGLKTTAITYAGSTSGTTPPSEGWQTQVPTVQAGQFLWTKTVWTYTDNSNETGYSVAKMGQDGAKGNDGIAGKDGVGIETTLIEYAVSTSGTTRPASGWSTTIPNTPQGQYLWTRTTWTYTDDTTEQGYSVARMGQDGARGNDGIAGKDGVGLKSTGITYAGSASGTTPPSTGWQAQVPTVPAGQYLWTKTVWTYTDNSNETGYSVARMGQNGNNGKDGIAGKDGVGINDTLIEYAVNTSGTTRPTSGWSTSIPTVPQGQYLWTRTTWTYTDNTTEQGFTVARQGEKGDKGDKGDRGIAGPKGADGKTQYTHIAYADNANGGGFSQSPTGKAYIGMYVDFEELDSSDPTKYAWSLIKGADGEQGVAGPKGEDGRTPYFHTAYINSTDFGAYDYSGNPNLMVPLKASDFYPQSGATIEDYRDALKVTFTKTDGAVFLGTSTNIPALLPNTQYTLSADVTVSEGYTGKLENLRLGYRKFPGGTIILPLTAKDAVVGQKTRISITANSSAATDPSIFDRMYFTINTTSTDPFVGTVLIENIKVEQGTAATPYQPNIKGAPWYFSTVPLGENIADPAVKFPISSSSEGIYSKNALEDFVLGETYTVTIGATKPASQTIRVYLAQKQFSNFKPVEGLVDTWVATVSITRLGENAKGVYLFQTPNTSLGSCTIKWLKIEKGDTRTPNIDDYKYLGNYTDFVQADSLNPTKYSWSLIRGNDGQDGAPAKALTLQADSPVMKFDANDVVVAGQVITFTAFKQNFDSNIAWVATPYKGNTAQPAIALKGTGDVRTLEASMWASGVTTIRVDVSADTFRDSVTITKVKDGAKGDRGNDGVAGKDGVGIRSTAITYAGSASGTTPPTTGWQTQVPTVPAGQFLWTKTVWTYTDNSTETGYSAAMMGKDGAKGNDGIAGKDGVGIKTTVIEYAVNTSGTVKPTSGWTSAVPNTPQGQYLWTRTTWTYTDNTTEQGFTVARQGSNGQNGTNGTNGIDAYSAFLTNEANTFAANPSGAVSDWSTGRGTFMVYKGTTRVTTGIAFAVESTSNATGTIDPTSGNYAVTGMSSDNATLTFKATIGSTVLTKTMTLSKSRQGVQGVQGTMGIAFYSPTAPTGSNVTDGATWFKTTSASDNTIVSINTYKGGKWVSTPVASGALAVENLSAISATLGDITAGSLTGVDITGATFINPFDFVGLDGNHLKGSTIIKDSEIEISGIANEGDANARKFSKEIAPLSITDTLRDGSDNILSSMSSSSTGIYLTDNVGKTNATLSGFGLQLTDWSGSERFDGRLTAKALTNTPWKLLTLDSSMYEVAENNPPMYRIIYNLDGSRTIKYKGQFKLKTGYMKEGVEYYPFRKNGAGNATLLPDEVRPDQTEFAYAAAGVAPGQKTNAGGRIGVTKTPNMVISPGLGEVLYFGISSLNYTVL